jgi:hypothetical protein
LMPSPCPTVQGNRRGFGDIDAQSRCVLGGY